MTSSFRLPKLTNFWHFYRTFVNSKCKQNSLRSQCCMRLFGRFSNTVKPPMTTSTASFILKYKGNNQNTTQVFQALLFWGILNFLQKAKGIVNELLSIDIDDDDDLGSNSIGRLHYISPVSLVIERMQKRRGFGFKANLKT